jgi:hypothetical protein
MTERKDVSSVLSRTDVLSTNLRKLTFPHPQLFVLMSVKKIAQGGEG